MVKPKWNNVCMCPITECITIIISILTWCRKEQKLASTFAEALFGGNCQQKWMPMSSSKTALCIFLQSPVFTMLHKVEYSGTLNVTLC